jgi:hypothetical protein
MVVLRILTSIRIAADIPVVQKPAAEGDAAAVDNEEPAAVVEEGVRRLRECTQAQADIALPNEAALLNTIKEILFTQKRGNAFAAILSAITEVGENEKPASLDTVNNQLSTLSNYLKFLATKTPASVCVCFGKAADNLLAPAEVALKLLRLAAKQHAGLTTKKEINASFLSNEQAVRVFRGKVRCV